MQKFVATTATVITVILLMASMTAAAFGQLSHVGNTPPSTPGYPTLGPLPAGVTATYTLNQIAYMSLSPNPIGVGQTLLVNVWASPGTYHAFYMQGYEVDIKKPDGTTETVGPFNSYLGDCTAWFNYVPDQAGTWQFKFIDPGTYIPNGTYWDFPGSETGGFIASGKYYTLYTSMYYTGDETDWQNLTVLPDMVSSWPYVPLPADYWTRPVNVMWRDWSPNLGSYPFDGSVYYYPDGGRTLYASNYKYTAYVTAPNSAHVMRKQLGSPATLSGMVGGYTYQYSYASGPGTPSIIFQGRCYQSLSEVVNGQDVTVWQCYDLRTGQVYWERQPPTTTVMSLFGPMTTTLTPQYVEYYLPSPATMALASPGHEADVGWQIYLIRIDSGRLLKWDPATGALAYNISISPVTSATYYAPTLALSVQDLGSSLPSDQRYRLINWTTGGTTSNFTARVLGNVSWPFSGLGNGFSNVADYEAGLIASCSWASPPGPQWCIGVDITVTDLVTGQNLWHYATNDTETESAQSPSSFIMDHGKIAFGSHGRHWACWDARTGKKLWESELTDYPWGAWFPYNTASFDINETTGAIITSTYEGVYAINWADGKILWHYSPTGVPFENPYYDDGHAATPFFTGVESADGKIYAYNGEHTPSFPRARDWSLYCINGTTGELIWKIYNPMVPGAIADGYLTASNPYDGYMYVFGKGQSATTVTAPDVAVPLGTGFTIKGTVLDQSPAQPGTPCVSKDSMELEMEYIHEQMPITGLWGNETITGVPVTLTAIGSDGSVYDLGSTTTNGYGGNFGMNWTAPKADLYTIYAAFAGDDSYGSSTAYTTVTVGPAPAVTPPVEIPTPVDYTMTIAYAAIAIIIAVVIAVAVAVLLLRKR
jgi:outer membrane protein assembly factor BamB